MVMSWPLLLPRFRDDVVVRELVGNVCISSALLPLTQKKLWTTPLNGDYSKCRQLVGVYVQKFHPSIDYNWFTLIYIIWQSFICSNDVPLCTHPILSLSLSFASYFKRFYFMPGTWQRMNFFSLPSGQAWRRVCHRGGTSLRFLRPLSRICRTLPTESCRLWLGYAFLDEWLRSSRQTCHRGHRTKPQFLQEVNSTVGS